MNEKATLTMAVLILDSFAGITQHEVEIIGYTKSKRVRIKVLHDMKWPGRNRFAKAGDIKIVPAYAIRKVNHEH